MTNQDSVFRSVARIEDTEGPQDVWLPGLTATVGPGPIPPEAVYADPVIIPVPAPFDHSLWPPMS